MIPFPSLTNPPSPRSQSSRLLGALRTQTVLLGVLAATSALGSAAVVATEAWGILSARRMAAQARREEQSGPVPPLQARPDVAGSAATTANTSAAAPGAPVIEGERTAGGGATAGCPEPAPPDFVARLRSARVRPIEDGALAAEQTFERWVRPTAGRERRRAPHTGRPAANRTAPGDAALPLLVVIGRTDCGPCKEQAAAIGDLARRARGRTTVVGLLAEEASAAALDVYQRAFASEGIPYAFWSEGEEHAPDRQFPLTLWLTPSNAASVCFGPIYRRTSQGIALEGWLARLE
jgi:hypothetical protein